MKKISKAEIAYILDQVLLNAYQQMRDLEEGIRALNLKGDGSDDPLLVQRKNIHGVLLTLINDVIHSGHDYAKLILPDYVSEIERYQRAQQLAFEEGRVMPCVCKKCAKPKKD